MPGLSQPPAPLPGVMGLVTFAPTAAEKFRSSDRLHLFPLDFFPSMASLQAMIPSKLRASAHPQQEQRFRPTNGARERETWSCAPPNF